MKSEGREPRLSLVCFAVREESKPFERAAKAQANVQVLITGMGRRNAERAIRERLDQQRPDLVISSGFAGGLKPDLLPGTVVFASEPATDLTSSFLAAGASPARFICSGRIAATALEKGALRQSTGADAIEMESEVICAVCQERRIPSVTLRVILDAAHEDLPFDFNQFLTANQQLDWRKMALVLIRSPNRIAALRKLQQRSAMAAGRLAEVLMKALAS